MDGRLGGKTNCLCVVGKADFNQWLVPPSSSSSSSDITSWWRRHPCLVCGKKWESSPTTTNENENSNASYSSSQHKRCSRCHAVVYCSLQCQRHGIIGKHKPSCIKIGNCVADRLPLLFPKIIFCVRGERPAKAEIFTLVIQGKKQLGHHGCGFVLQYLIELSALQPVL